MQIDHINTFLDLVETRSFNTTADRLGVTQSSVSGRIKALEGQLNTRLFQRSRAGTALTPAGLRFEPHARALRLIWTEARQAVAQSEGTAMTLRVGIQHDLLDTRVGRWIGRVRDLVPEASLYIESDFSGQMCRDLAVGALDLAIIFTPSGQPDLHIESLGEVTYQMASTEVTWLNAVAPDRYFLPNYSDAFAQNHAALMPILSSGPISSGQARVVRELLLSMGGTAYLPQETVQDLTRDGLAHPVADAPPITQSVFAAVHLRNRHRPVYRRVLRGLSREVHARPEAADSVPQ